MNKDLKACPCCGMEARLVSSTKSGFIDIEVNCLCGINLSMMRKYIDNQNDLLEMLLELREEVVKKWNLRKG